MACYVERNQWNIEKSRKVFVALRVRSLAAKSYQTVGVFWGEFELAFRILTRAFKATSFRVPRLR